MNDLPDQISPETLKRLIKREFGEQAAIVTNYLLCELIVSICLWNSQGPSSAELSSILPVASHHRFG